MDVGRAVYPSVGFLYYIDVLIEHLTGGLQ